MRNALRYDSQCFENTGKHVSNVSKTQGFCHQGACKNLGFYAVCGSLGDP